MCMQKPVVPSVRWHWQRETADFDAWGVLWHFLTGSARDPVAAARRIGAGAAGAASIFFSARNAAACASSRAMIHFSKNQACGSKSRKAASGRGGWAGECGRTRAGTHDLDDRSQRRSGIAGVCTLRPRALRVLTYTQAGACARGAPLLPGVERQRPVARAGGAKGYAVLYTPQGIGLFNLGEAQLSTKRPLNTN